MNNKKKVSCKMIRLLSIMLITLIIMQFANVNASMGKNVEITTKATIEQKFEWTASSINVTLDGTQRRMFVQTPKTLLDYEKEKMGVFIYLHDSNTASYVDGLCDNAADFWVNANDETLEVPAYVFAPDFSTDGVYKAPTLKDLTDLVDYIRANYSVDDKRFFICGQRKSADVAAEIYNGFNLSTHAIDLAGLMAIDMTVKPDSTILKGFQYGSIAFYNHTTHPNFDVEQSLYKSVMSKGGDVIYREVNTEDKVGNQQFNDMTIQWLATRPTNFKDNEVVPNCDFDVSSTSNDYGSELDYVLYHPRLRNPATNDSTDKKYPLFVQLLGSGGYSTVQAAMQGQFQLDYWFLRSNSEAPYFRVFPNFEICGDAQNLIPKMVSELIEKYPIDPDRVCILGFSLGGFSAFSIPAQYPDMFAGIVCSSSKPLDYDGLYKTAHIPTFVTHGLPDTNSIVPYKTSRRTFNRLTELGCEAVYQTEKPAHEETRDSRGEGMMGWLLGCNRQNNIKKSAPVGYKPPEFTVEQITDASTSIVGTTKPYYSVNMTVTRGTQTVNAQIAETDENGVFLVDLPATNSERLLKIGDKVTLSVNGLYGAKGEESVYTVIDGTRPSVDSLKKILRGARSVSGETDMPCQVYVTKHKAMLDETDEVIPNIEKLKSVAWGTAVAAKNGAFTVKTKRLNKGTKLDIITVSNAGVFGDYATATVVGASVDKVNVKKFSLSKGVLTGTCEKGSKVFVKLGKKVIARVKAKKSTFFVKFSKKIVTILKRKNKKGLKLNLYCKNKFGDKSKTVVYTVGKKNIK